MTNPASEPQRNTPVITGFRVIPVAGRDGMLLNLSGAHAPFFTRNLVVLTAEYVTSTFHNPEQLAKAREALERFKESTRVLLEDAVPEGVPADHPLMDDAIELAVSTGAGLAMAQALGTIDAERGASLMVANMKLWFDALAVGKSN